MLQQEFQEFAEILDLDRSILLKISMVINAGILYRENTNPSRSLLKTAEEILDIEDYYFNEDRLEEADPKAVKLANALNVLNPLSIPELLKFCYSIVSRLEKIEKAIPARRDVGDKVKLTLNSEKMSEEYLDYLLKNCWNPDLEIEINGVLDEVCNPYTAELPTGKTIYFAEADIA